MRDRKKEQFLAKMLLVDKEDLVFPMKKSDRIKKMLRMSQNKSQVANELRESKTDLGPGFPSFPIIELPIDQLEAFDYENAENAKYSVDELRGILIDEIRHFNTKNESKPEIKRQALSP